MLSGPLKFEATEWMEQMPHGLDDGGPTGSVEDVGIVEPTGLDPGGYTDRGVQMARSYSMDETELFESG